jgi:hypothetical protein
MPNVRAIGLFLVESEFRADGEQFAKRQGTKLPLNHERPSKVDAAFPRRKAADGTGVVDAHVVIMLPQSIRSWWQHLPAAARLILVHLLKLQMIGLYFDSR